MTNRLSPTSAHSQYTVGQILPTIDWDRWKRKHVWADGLVPTYLRCALSFPDSSQPTSDQIMTDSTLPRKVYLNFGDAIISLAQFMENPASRPPGVAIVWRAATRDEGAKAICWDDNGFWHIEEKAIIIGHPVLKDELADNSFARLGRMETYSLDLLPSNVHSFIEENRAGEGMGFDSFEAACARLEEIAASRDIADPLLVVEYALRSVPSDPSPMQCLMQCVNDEALHRAVRIMDREDWGQIQGVYKLWIAASNSPLALPVEADGLDLSDADRFLRPTLYGIDPALPFTVRRWEKQ